MQKHSAIELEKSRIETALLDPATSPDKYCLLYAAQQAICWTMTPDLAASPYDVITQNRVMPLITDTLEG